MNPQEITGICRSVRVMTEQDEVLNIDQLSRYLRVPKSTLYRLAAEGEIPSHKVGRHWRFRRESVDRWLDRPGREHNEPTGDIS